MYLALGKALSVAEPIQGLVYQAQRVLDFNTNKSFGSKINLIATSVLFQLCSYKQARVHVTLHLKYIILNAFLRLCCHY